MSRDIHKAMLSPEVKVILSGKPNFLVRWGTAIIALMVLIGLLCCYNRQVKTSKKNTPIIHSFFSSI